MEVLKREIFQLLISIAILFIQGNYFYEINPTKFTCNDIIPPGPGRTSALSTDTNSSGLILDTIIFVFIIIALEFLFKLHSVQRKQSN